MTSTRGEGPGNLRMMNINVKNIANFLTLTAALCLLGAHPGSSRGITIASGSTRWHIDPATLQVRALPSGLMSEGLGIPASVSGLTSTRTRASWNLQPRSLHVEAAACASGGLQLTITAHKPQDLELAITPLDTISDELIWPSGAGLLVPLKDPFWRDSILNESWDTLETLSLPLVAVRRSGATRTWILSPQFCNNIEFRRTGARPVLTLTHAFSPRTTNQTLAIRFYCERGVSPIQPALHYRQWLIESGRFRTLAGKEKAAPAVSRLRGAICAYAWGSSSNMLHALKDAGISRARLCADSLSALQAEPDVARLAAASGYLFGVYDSYHSVQDPSASASDSWDTALMTQDLYNTGGILNASGAYLKGFRGIGRKMSPKAVRPFYEQRAGGSIRKFGLNYYFIDCDATGEVYDDYNSLHPMTVESDAAERASRLAWLTSSQGSVVGSEGGSPYAVPSIHVAEGMLYPYFGWGDDDLTNPSSPYFRGGYYPPTGPRVMFQPSKLKPAHIKRYFDPRYRLPLYNAAFHDCVEPVAHWTNGHFKYPEVRQSVALTELLYLSPPLVHANQAEIAKRRKLLAEHYAVWSPLHSKFGFSPLTSFSYLSASRDVQRSTYGKGCEITVNFGKKPVRLGSLVLPPMSALIDAPSVFPSPKIYTPSPM